MLHPISIWIKESFGSYLGFLIVLLLFICSFFCARIAYIFNIGNMRSRREWDSSGDLDGGGGGNSGDGGGGE